MRFERHIGLAALWFLGGACAAALALAPGASPASAAALEHSQRPGYRGPGTSGIYPARGLLKSWPTGGPELLWQTPLGVGAGPVTVWDGKVYLIAGADAWLYVFGLDGKPFGKAHLGSASWKRFGFPRSTPLVAEGLAIGTTPNANLYAVDLQTMETRWQVNAWADFGSGKGDQGWGLPESPILHGPLVVFNPVSRDDATPPLVAVDVRDGRQVVWGMDPGQGKAYSAGDVSAALFRHRGRNLIVSPTWCYVVCLDADTGKVLWEVPSVGEKTLTPVYQDGLLLIPIIREVAAEGERAWPAWPSLPLDSRRAGTAGSPRATGPDADASAEPATLRQRMRQTEWGPEEIAMLRLSDDGQTARVLWVRQDAPDRFGHAVILDGRVWCFGHPDSLVERSKDGLLPPLPERPRRTRGASFLCLDAATGEVLAAAPAETPGHVVAADGMVYAVDLVRVPKPHDPTARPRQVPRLRLVRPTAGGFEIAGELRPFSYDDAPGLRDGEWEASVPPVVAEGRLFWKFGPLMAFDVRGPDYEPLPKPPPLSAPPLDPEGPFPKTSPADVRPADVPLLMARLGSRLEARRREAAALLAASSMAGNADLALKLAEQMTSGGEEAWPRQAAAAEALSAMGPNGRAAVPLLQKALPAAVSDRDGTLARLILAALRTLDEQAVEPTAAPVAALLAGPDPYVQYLAAGLLKRMGPGGRGGAVSLAAVLPSPDARVRHEAAAALSAIGPDAKEAVPRLGEALVQALKERREALCGLIMDVFAAVDPKGIEPVVPQIAALVATGRPDVRRLAARTLSQAGEAGAAAIPGLVNALQSDDEAILSAASAALADMGPAAGALAKVVAEGEGPAPVTAAQVLARMGPKAAPAVGALAKALGREDLVLARAAAKALGAIGPDAKDAVGALAEALTHKDRELASAAGAALGAIGPDAKPAAPALLAALKHGDTVVRTCAAASLQKIGQSPVPAILDLLRKGSSRDQPWAAGALAQFPEAAKDTVPALVEALGSADERLVSGALGTIRTLGPGAQGAVPALVTMARSEDPRRAAQAIAAIGQIGPGAKAAVPALVSLVQSKDRPLAFSAIQALAGIGPAAEPAVAPLVALSRQADRPLGEAIQRTLEQIKTKNVPPNAQNVAATCPEGGSVVIGLPISDEDDVIGRLGVRAEDYPRGGSLDRPDWGTITYRSRPGFVGQDAFTWRASDRGEVPSRLAKATVTVTADTAGPEVLEAAVPLGERETVIVSFNEPVTADSATAPANFSISRGVQVLKAALDESGRTVTLTTTPLPADATCTLSAKAIADRAKAANRGGGNAEFVYRPLVPGLTYKYYDRVPEFDRNRRDLADLDALAISPNAAGVVPDVRLPVAKLEGAFLLRFDGVLDVPRGPDGTAYGEYVFSTLSSGASRLYLDGGLVVDNRGGGRAPLEAERSTTLAAGRHLLTVIYWQSGGTSAALKATWSGPSLEKQEIPRGALLHVSPAAATDERPPPADP